MNDDATPELTHFDPPLTPETLRAQCPEHFTAAGCNFHGEVEGPWYNDETVPWTFQVHDEDHDVWEGFDMDGDWENRPTYGQVLWQLFSPYSDLDIALEQLSPDVQRLLTEAEVARLEARAMSVHERANAIHGRALLVAKGLDALGGSDLTTQLLKTFHNAPEPR